MFLLPEKAQFAGRRRRDRRAGLGRRRVPRPVASSGRCSLACPLLVLLPTGDPGLRAGRPRGRPVPGLHRAELAVADGGGHRARGQPRTPRRHSRWPRSGCASPATSTTCSGRELSTIAVQAELAATLAERGDPRAPQHILQVRETAHEALREARELARGYRPLDLAAEVDGAVSLLAVRRHHGDRRPRRAARGLARAGGPGDPRGGDQRAAALHGHPRRDDVRRRRGRDPQRRRVHHDRGAREPAAPGWPVSPSSSPRPAPRSPPTTRATTFVVRVQLAAAARPARGSDRDPRPARRRREPHPQRAGADARPRGRHRGRGRGGHRRRGRSRPPAPPRPTSPCSTCRCPTGTASPWPRSWPRTLPGVRLHDRHQPRPARATSSGPWRAGCEGFLPKTTSAATLAQVVRIVHARRTPRRPRAGGRGDRRRRLAR